MNPKQIKVAQEIVDTEVTYVKNLQKLEEMFRRRLKNHITVGRPVRASAVLSLGCLASTPLSLRSLCRRA